jgi:hypothetical protein
MRFPSQKLQGIHIWLTAVMVLIAGSPYVSCRCPDGHRKLFCFNSPAQLNGCCGDSRCCISPEEKPPCCRKHENQDDIRSSACCRMDGAKCSKILTPSALVATNNTPPPAGDATAVQPLAFSLSSHLILAPLGLARSPRCWWDHHSPPPADLVVTLRHLLV